MTRRNALLIALTLGIAALGGWQLAAQTPAYDVLIRGGKVVDGTGNPYFYGDVALKGGRIAAVGRLPSATATRVIDATGLVVAPGFIDLHTHSELTLLADGTAQSKIRQGVTVDVTGERESVAPRDGLKPAAGSGPAQTWTTFTGYFVAVEHSGISMNVIAHVASDLVRRVVMGYSTAPATPAQLEQMKKLVARSMEEGAWGLVALFESGGPQYPEEIIEMAKVVKAYGGNYTTHIGSEGNEQDKELDFAIRVAEEVKLPVHIFHFKIRGEKLYSQLPGHVKKVQAARDRGLDITANVYPYLAMSHGWSSCFPLWMREGGPEKFAERLKDLSLRDKLKKDPDFIAWSEEHGWWEGIAMARAQTPRNREYEGMRVAQIAKIRGDADPADTFINLMAAEGGVISGIFHNQSEENMRLVLSQPWVAPSSDASALNLEAPGFPHPRSYGTNARVLGKYVREEKLLTLEDAVRKMSSLPAQILGIRDRGQLREGFIADVVVFDQNTIKDTNSYEKPKSYSVGVPYVLVNGVVVIDKGEHTGARPGKALRGPGYKPTKATSSAAQ